MPFADKERQKEYKRLYYIKNKDKLDEQNKQWGIKNRKKLRKYRHLYYLEHREKSKKYAYQYYLENKEGIKKRTKQYYADNIEKGRINRRNYHNQNREKLNLKTKKWCEENMTSEKIRKRQLKYKYNLSMEDYEKLLNKQNGKCGICSNTTAYENGKGHLFVDHDHQTEEIRGLLCRKCNNNLSILEKEDLLKGILNYLKEQAWEIKWHH